MSSFVQDLRFAFRNLRKSPGLVAAAVFSLAIGIGANTTIYSAIEALRLADAAQRSLESGRPVDVEPIS